MPTLVTITGLKLPASLIAQAARSSISCRTLLNFFILTALRWMNELLVAGRNCGSYEEF